MTTITAELQIGTIEELIQRRRVARLIVVGSASFTALIAAIAGTSGSARFPARRGTALAA
jgi:hypothetical protein